MALSISRGALEKGQIPPNVGLWWVHGVFLLVGLVIFNGPGLRRVFVSGARRSGGGKSGGGKSGGGKTSSEVAA